MKKARLATAWLDGCSGCHMSVLDIDEALVAVAERAEIVYGPLVDAQKVPEGIDVAVIEGAVSSQDDLALARALRANATLVVALGDCAVTSNVPSLRNAIPVRQLLERVYLQGVDANPCLPSEVVPALLKAALPLHEVIKVDLHVPGCPPKPAAILHVLTELLDGRMPELGSKLRFG